VLTGFYVPLAMIGVFVLGFGAITKISANLPDPPPADSVQFNYESM
jgi:hypothetical protein